MKLGTFIVEVKSNINFEDGQVNDLWTGQIEDFNNAHSECIQDCMVYMCRVHIPVEYLYISAPAVY